MVWSGPGSETRMMSRSVDVLLCLPWDSQCACDLFSRMQSIFLLLNRFCDRPFLHYSQPPSGHCVHNYSRGRRCGVLLYHGTGASATGSGDVSGLLRLALQRDAQHRVTKVYVRSCLRWHQAPSSLIGKQQRQSNHGISRLSRRCGRIVRKLSLSLPLSCVC